jgi:hypothetical protein
LSSFSPARPVPFDAFYFDLRRYHFDRRHSTITEVALPMLPELLATPRQIERAGQRPGRFKLTAAYRKRQVTNPE